MRVISFWTVELYLALAYIIVRLVTAIITKKLDIKRELLMLLMYVNLAVIIRFIYFDLEDMGDLVVRFRFYEAPKINLVPFAHMFDFIHTSSAVINVGGNVLMFVPTGIIVPILFKKLDSFPKTVLAGFLLSLAIELSQLLTPARVTDVDDLIMNTLGAAIGYGIYALARHVIRARKES